MSEHERIDRKSLTVVVTGRVQGVAYRAWTKREAEARGLAGHVRNRDDGAVEAVFAGSAGSVDAMVLACWAGPPSARVQDVRVTAGGATGPSAGFSIAH